MGLAGTPGTAGLPGSCPPEAGVDPGATVPEGLAGRDTGPMLHPLRKTARTISMQRVAMLAGRSFP